jgi:hypothetical protein
VLRAVSPIPPFRTPEFGGMISRRMIFPHRSDRIRGLPAPLALLLMGAALTSAPSAAAAQSVGTLQVTARVRPAPSAWPVLAAAARLAARAEASPSAPAVIVGLARLRVEEAASDPRTLRLRIDYLRN